MHDNINYEIDKGLIFMLAGLAGVSKKEVWCQLADCAQECVERIKKKKSQRESWKWFTFPGTDIKMKVKIYFRKGHTGYDNQYYPDVYNANIKLDRNGYEKFTSDQVQEFLIEEILLGSEAAQELNE